MTGVDGHRAWCQRGNGRQHAACSATLGEVPTLEAGTITVRLYAASAGSDPALVTVVVGGNGSSQAYGLPSPQVASTLADHLRMAASLA